MRHIPFSLSCKTFYSASKERLNDPPGCPVSPRVAIPIQLSCATELPSDDAINLGLNLKRTNTILVSSNSCWTLMMVSACLGSWYFWIYVVISGKDIDDGLLKDD